MNIRTFFLPMFVLPIVAGVALIVSAASAQPVKRVGEWDLFEGARGISMSRVNPEGTVLTYFCSDAAPCAYSLRMRGTCGSSKQASVLTTSSPTPLSIRFSCFEEPPSAHFMLSTSMAESEGKDVLSDALLQSTVATFTIPLENGGMAVSRFPLEGYKQAYTMLMDMHKARDRKGK